MNSLSGAFILITTENGAEAHVLDQLKTISGIKQALMVSGFYDIVVQIADESLDAIKDSILKEIRNIDSIKSTSTLLLREK